MFCYFTVINLKTVVEFPNDYCGRNCSNEYFFLNLNFLKAVITDTFVLNNSVQTERFISLNLDIAVSLLSRGLAVHSLPVSVNIFVKVKVGLPC